MAKTVPQILTVLVGIFAGLLGANAEVRRETVLYRLTELTCPDGTIDNVFAHGPKLFITFLDRWTVPTDLQTLEVQLGQNGSTGTLWADAVALERLE